MSKKRWYKARPVVQKVVGPNGLTYDSQSELRLHLDQLADFSLHCCKIPYTSFHEYNPDFVLTTDQGRLIVEVKGFFQDSAEARKYKDVREALDEGDELVFVFDKPNAKLPWSTRRKDGSYFTHIEWATRNGFRAYGPDATREEIMGNHTTVGASNG